MRYNTKFAYGEIILLILVFAIISVSVVSAEQNKQSGNNQPGCLNNQCILQCSSNATVTIHFLNVSNTGAGNLKPIVFINSTTNNYTDLETIPLFYNGTPITDSQIIENVPGIGLQRINGTLRFLLYGSLGSSDQKILTVNITLNNAIITGFQNDFSSALTAPNEPNNLENQGDGIYQLGNPFQDEVFPGIGSNTAKWFSTVTQENDGFFLTTSCASGYNQAPQNITCNTNLNCGTDTLLPELFCSGNNVTQNVTTFTCHNAGTTQSFCTNFTSTQTTQQCNNGCSNGFCNNPPITCNSNAQCGTDTLLPELFCSGNNVSQSKIVFTCNNPGTIQSSCSNSTIKVTDSLCLTNQTCNSGSCIPIGQNITNITCSNDLQCNDNNASTQDICNNPGTLNSTCSHIPINATNGTEITCNTDLDCGISGLIGGLFCSGNNVSQSKIVFTCNNNGTVNSFCTNSTVQIVNSTCAFGCSNNLCTNQTNTGNQSLTVTITDPTENEQFDFTSALNLRYSVNGNASHCWFNIDNGINITIPSCSGTTFDATIGDHKVNLFASNSNIIASDSKDFSVIESNQTNTGGNGNNGGSGSSYTNRSYVYVFNNQNSPAFTSIALENLSGSVNNKSLLVLNNQDTSISSLSSNWIVLILVIAILVILIITIISLVVMSS